ncbi:MAG: hypothetical protein KDB60_12300 [Propionibacteriaceae bacterium]|nr:hypothetical protein [Propionibacteriaceae bacterium]
MRALPRPALVGFLASGAVYVLGAVGLEAIGGYLADNGGFNSVGFVVECHLEELFEMLGQIGFLASVGALARTWFGPAYPQEDGAVRSA